LVHNSRPEPIIYYWQHEVWYPLLTSDLILHLTGFVPR
jgi:hypothetical protein